MTPVRTTRSAAILSLLLLPACNLAPAYRPPETVIIPDSFKEAPGWRTANPSDAVARGQWWTLFNEAALDELEAEVLISNQNLAAAHAAYDQARALVREQRAELLPTVDLSANANRAGTLEHGAIGGTRYALSVGGTWEPDLWGRIRNSVTQAGAEAQASLADLVNATLSAQGELALDYVQLRGTEAQKAILVATIAAYEKALTIATNRYNAGVAARSDVLQAETALRSARANAADLDRQRALFEHAIAVLVGENPSSFAVRAAPWAQAVPEVPSVLPAALLERRPDIAAAERRVAAANANIGIQRAAYFPAINLAGDVGYAATSAGALFDVASSVWSFGLTGAVSLLDFGARSARIDAARATHDQAAAQYRQTVLTAFQQTEDALAAVRVLATVAEERAAAAKAANQAESIGRNQYFAGQIGYADLIVIQTFALSARQSEAQAITDRQSAAIALIQAIGGSWQEETSGVSESQ